MIKLLNPTLLFLRDTIDFVSGVEVAKARNPDQDNSGFSTNMNYESALNQARSMKAFVNGTAEDIDSRLYQIAKYNVEWHRKLSLSAACFVLFLIGAPLGAIIRKVV